MTRHFTLNLHIYTFAMTGRNNDFNAVTKETIELQRMTDDLLNYLAESLFHFHACNVSLQCKYVL